MMLGGNDFDLNQQGRPSYYESVTNLFHKNKIFTLNLSLQRKHSASVAFYINHTQKSWTVITETDFSWSHSLKYFLGAQREEMPTRYHGNASGSQGQPRKSERPGKSNINSLRKKISSKPTTSDWLNQAEKGTCKWGENTFVVSTYTVMIFPLFSYKFCFLNLK